jgi:peptide/nickel transport system ATP-binding protein
MTAPAPLLSVRNLKKHFAIKGGLLSREVGRVHAVDGVSLDIAAGETLGMVGESGCGKSTTSMMVMRLLDQTSGRIVFDGEDIGSIMPNAFGSTPQRKRIQMVFQDPTDSLNPRFTAARAIADPILRLGEAADRARLRDRIEDLARKVGLPVELLDRFPHQLSGGQKARVGIARAIALEPKLVILDEPTAALDVSVQAVVLNLLQDLKQQMGMSYLFVSHDLNVVRLLCDRVIVMRSGRIVEEGQTEAVMSNPKSDYTRELLSAIPHPPLPGGALVHA